MEGLRKEAEAGESRLWGYTVRERSLAREKEGKGGGGGRRGKREGERMMPLKSVSWIRVGQSGEVGQMEPILQTSDT